VAVSVGSRVETRVRMPKRITTPAVILNA